MSESRIYVRLSQDEFDALYNAAVRDYRRPADQARAILRDALLRNDQEKHNGAGIRQDSARAAVSD